jgi:hypothetical protein
MMEDDCSECHDDNIKEPDLNRFIVSHAYGRHDDMKMKIYAEPMM